VSHLDIALCPHESCASLFHLTCLSSRLEQSDSILPVNGTCPVCQKEILWGDVIRGVFGRAGHMETNLQDDDSEETDDSDSEDDDKPIKPRKKRVSGPVRLTGKSKITPKTTPKTTPQKSRKKTANKTSVQQNIPLTNNEATPKPLRVRKQPVANPTNPLDIEDGSNTGRLKPSIPAIPGHSQPKRPIASNQTAPSLTIPDSAGEANDVWVISSDDD
jgi:hypothetical protein